MNANNRDRILQSSIHLFNANGVVSITTNHIARHLKISPGNLYFHFQNKEEIVLELFGRMTEELGQVWEASNTNPILPRELIHLTMEIFWKYRFFHREMYHLRRRDEKLSKAWRM